MSPVASSGDTSASAISLLAMAMDTRAAMTLKRSYSSLPGDTLTVTPFWAYAQRTSDSIWLNTSSGVGYCALSTSGRLTSVALSRLHLW